MKAAHTKSINMTYRALLSYVLNTNYRNFSGILALMVSAVAIAILIFGWSSLSGTQKVLVVVLGSTFTIINPLLLALKTFRQFKLSVSYKKPLVYTFDDKGILIEREEIKQQLEWNRVIRVLMTKSMIAIYTSRLHAFVIPLSELGKEKDKIITAIVQFTDEYKPTLSRNLKEYKSGKGYKGDKL